MITLASALLAGACLLVLVAGVGAAFAVLVMASITVAVGECLYTTVLLSVSPAAAFISAAALAAVAGMSALRLERQLPRAARRTPRPASG